MNINMYHSSIIIALINTTMQTNTYLFYSNHPKKSKKFDSVVRLFVLYSAEHWAAQLEPP